MRLTIIKGDHKVYVDGLPLPVDCSDLPANFHALQWYDTWGDVEIVDANGHNAANIKITDLTPYQAHIDAWTAAKVALDAKAAAAVAAKAKQGGVSVITQ
jgi:hypothetical protein